MSWHGCARAQRMSVVFERRGDQKIAEKWQGWRLGNLRPVFEPILWFTKPYTIGTTIADNARDHGTGGYNEDAFVRYSGQPNNVLASQAVPDTRSTRNTSSS